MKTFLRVLVLLTSGVGSLVAAENGAHRNSAASNTAAPNTAALLPAGDSFELRLAGVPAAEMVQISASYTVDEKGLVNVPYIGRMRAEGMTGAELCAAIENEYKRSEIFTNPTVVISVEAAARFVNVSGQVRAPQRVSYTADLTVLKAITAAGDFNDFADQGHVSVLRGKDVIPFNARAAQKDPAHDFKLVPGDQIVVPQSLWR